jgi:hypothetical protein
MSNRCPVLRPPVIFLPDIAHIVRLISARRVQARTVTEHVLDLVHDLGSRAATGYRGGRSRPDECDTTQHLPARTGKPFDGNNRQPGQEVTNNPTVQDKVLQNLEKVKLRNRADTINSVTVNTDLSTDLSPVVGRVMSRVVGIGH